MCKQSLKLHNNNIPSNIIYCSSQYHPFRFFLKSCRKGFQQRSMRNFQQLSLVFVIIQVSMSSSARMFGIYRGKIDRYSRDIMNSELAATCDTEYCTCSQSKRTFTYDTGSQKGNCVTNDDFRTSQGKNYIHFLAFFRNILPFKRPISSVMQFVNSQVIMNSCEMKFVLYSVKRLRDSYGYRLS